MKHANKFKGHASTWQPPARQSFDDTEKSRHAARMAGRVAKLEAATDYLQRDLGALCEVTEGIAASNAESRERLIRVEARFAHVPTKLEMWAGFCTVLLTVGGAAAWLVQQYLAPLFARAAGG